MITLALLTAMSSAGLVALVRRYALRRAILDRPTERSSHREPTPRGGGLGAVAALVVAVVVATRADARLLLALAGVVLVAWVGWRDDHRGVQVRTRLVVHVTSGMLLLPLALLPHPVPAWLGWGAAAWWLFWTVSCVNVVNFMDGIDGLIGAQVVLFGAFCGLVGAPGGPAQAYGAALAGAAAGFLAWNWSPARIFLGDVGSGAFGAAMVVGGLLLLREGRVGVVEAFLPLYPIFLDASVTLVRRWRRGERVADPHREHLYQRLANEGRWGHPRVAVLYALAALAALPAIWLRRPDVTGLYFAGVTLAGLALDRRSPVRIP